MTVYRGDDPWPEWSVAHVPAAATQATIGKAAVADRRHYCAGLVVTLGDAATATGLTFNLRDGATGAGTVLWAVKLTNIANQTTVLILADMNIQGSINTAMTLETSAAPGALVSATVAMRGYTR